MRIDKYLWAVRYFKTRNKAAEACKKGQVSLNEVKAKPAKEVFRGDIIMVRKNQINYQLEVLDTPKNRIGTKLTDIFRKDITPKDYLEQKEFLSLVRSHHRKRGEGRPTKKDRRDIEGFTE